MPGRYKQREAELAEEMWGQFWLLKSLSIPSAQGSPGHIPVLQDPAGALRGSRTQPPAAQPALEHTGAAPSEEGSAVLC